jgi:cysteinyl-tRNA synthetase
MATKYLGETFDIHGGGVDNIFPHNECEIAQSEAAHDAPFARYWMLVGSLTLEGVKMSKSLGNTLTIRDALTRWRPEAIRTFILSSHYRSPIDFTREAVEAAEKGWQRIWSAVQLVRSQLAGATQGDADPTLLDRLGGYRERFEAHMNDDFNAPGALGVLQELVRETNTLINSGEALTGPSLEAIDTLYLELAGDVLGLLPAGGTSQADAAREEGLVQLLIALRAEARARKDWATSDKIRDELRELGIVLEDRADGTIWKEAG